MRTLIIKKILYHVGSLCVIVIYIDLGRFVGILEGEIDLVNTAKHYEQASEYFRSATK